VRLLRADFRDAIDAVIATPWDDLLGRRAELCPPIWCDAVIATPWDDLHPDVQTLMLSTVDDNPSSICAAIAFACGACPDSPAMTWKTAHTSQTAVTLAVWEVRAAEMRRTWRRPLESRYAHLAVQSPGPDPAFLAGATHNDALTAAVRRRTQALCMRIDDAAERWGRGAAIQAQHPDWRSCRSCATASAPCCRLILPLRPPAPICRRCRRVGMKPRGVGADRSQRLFRWDDRLPVSAPHRRAYHESDDSDDSVKGSSVMHLSFSEVTAALRALHGEPNPRIVAPAIERQAYARILALAPGVDPVIGALGALAGEVLGVLPPAMRDSPALSDAVASLIATDAGDLILLWWTDVAPAGWGANHAAALINAVHAQRVPRWVAAALIGHCDASAALLDDPWDISRAIQYWGPTTPDDPTAWMNALTPTERDRLLDELRHFPYAAAECLPWLPHPFATDIVKVISHMWGIRHALDAYTEASPATRAHHADVLTALIRLARWDNVADLTRLAVASSMDEAWTAIVWLLSTDPRSAIHVVTATPWNNVHADVQQFILSAAARSTICAAIAFARGAYGNAPPITQETARAFFASVTPEVWEALPVKERCAWLSRLDQADAHLAVRSLGLDPTFLAGAALNDDLIAAVRRHIRDNGDLRHTLLLTAVRDLPLAAVPAVVAALPPPPSPVAFVHIAGGAREMPPALRDWIAAHPMPQAQSAVIIILRTAARHGSSVERCATLSCVLAGWSWEETNALLAALSDDMRMALLPDADALTNALAHPDRRDAFRQALSALAALSPSAALPSFHALGALAEAGTGAEQRHAGEGFARTLHFHGRIFAAIVEMLRDDVRRSVLPSSHDPHVETTLRNLAADAPLVAHHLAYALHDNDPRAVCTALATMPPQEALRVWNLLPETLQHAVLGDRDALLADVATPERADDLAQALRAENNPLPLLALRMLIDADAERREQGMTILAQQPDRAAALLLLLRDDLRMILGSDPVIVFASADLPPPSHGRKRRRR